MESKPSKPWADTPYPLVPTPSLTRPLKTSHYSVTIATEMAHAHNTFIRALNSIYNQAPNVTNPTDIKDFLFYCNCWYKTVEHHHNYEETLFFPEVERIAKKPGLMQQNVEQHHAFHPGFHRFRDFSEQTVPEKYDATVLRGIMDDFSMILSKHLAEEIDTLLSLNDCDEKELKKAWKTLEAKVLASADKYTLFPLFFGCVDDTYENSFHKGAFPPTPWFVPYLIKYWYGRRYSGSWRFSPCDGFGRPRPLMFLN